MRVESVPEAVAIATGAQASSLAIIRRRDGTASGTVALQSYPVASTTPRELPARGPRSARGTDLVAKVGTLTLRTRLRHIGVVVQFECGARILRVIHGRDA